MDANKLFNPSICVFNSLFEIKFKFFVSSIAFSNVFCIDGIILFFISFTSVLEETDKLVIFCNSDIKGIENIGFFIIILYVIIDEIHNKIISTIEVIIDIPIIMKLSDDIYL